VIPRRLLATCYPGSQHIQEHETIIHKFIVDHAIDTVVNLMEADELLRFTPYQSLMQKLADESQLWLMSTPVSLARAHLFD
jgi:hypothetical protein